MQCRSIVLAVLLLIQGSAVHAGGAYRPEAFRSLLPIELPTPAEKAYILYRTTYERNLRESCSQKLEAETSRQKAYSSAEALRARAIDWINAQTSGHSEIAKVIDVYEPNRRLRILVHARDTSTFELLKRRLHHFGRGKSQFTVHVDQFLSVTVRNIAY